MTQHKKECPGDEPRALNKSLAGDLPQSNERRSNTQTLRQRRAQLITWCEEHGKQPGEVAGIGPSTYGMSRDEILAHANQLKMLHGWQDWELRARLTDPRTVTA